MITIEEIRQKALRRYLEYLRRIVVEDTGFFPLEIKGDKKNDKDFDALVEQHRPLFENEKQTKGFGYTLHTKINDRPGAKRIIQKIEFETEADYLKFTHKETEAHNFKVLVKITLEEFAELKDLLNKKPELLVDNLNAWNDLLKVCRYFKANPYPKLYIRELPITVDTKFIESKTGILSRLLQVIIPEHINEGAETFEDRFNLKTKHNLIRIRFLDDGLTPLSGFEEIGIGETEINTLTIPCKRVFIIENDITALIFPKMKDSIVLFGKGFNVTSLKNISWLKEAEIYYSSDIDVQGFEMLSQIRGYFPQTQSFLMDELTFQRFWSEEFRGAESNKSAPNLTESEEEFRKYLLINNKRLEHEKIPLSWIESQVQSVLNQAK